METTRTLLKLVASLDRAKARRESGLFMVQGTKAVADTAGCFEPFCLLATQEWLDSHETAFPRELVAKATSRDLQRATTLKNAPDVIAVYSIPADDFDRAALDDSLSLALDGVQDPGNLGTIMRVADWMGVRRILASSDCADPYAPKVVQATMGAIGRVKICRGHLGEMLQGLEPVCGTFLDGENIYSAQLPRKGVILMGSEGHGISPQLSSLVTRRLTIPSYPPGAVTSESLNVATAAAIVLSEFRRRQ